MTALNIFALNRDLDLRHTNLTRARGEDVVLPPLADWLRVARIDTNEIELFPVGDLDEMTLSDYITAAFAPEEDIQRSAMARLNALEGSVLLIPDSAMDGAPEPGAEAVLVAKVPLARPDHSADLPPVPVAPVPAPAPDPEVAGDRRARQSRAVWVVLGLLVIAGLIWMAT